MKHSSRCHSYIHAAVGADAFFWGFSVQFEPACICQWPIFTETRLSFDARCNYKHQTWRRHRWYNDSVSSCSVATGQRSGKRGVHKFREHHRQYIITPEAHDHRGSVLSQMIILAFDSNYVRNWYWVWNTVGAAQKNRTREARTTGVFIVRRRIYIYMKKKPTCRVLYNSSARRSDVCAICLSADLSGGLASYEYKRYL